MTTSRPLALIGENMATAADPIVLSETVQEFEGERYYLCGFYFQRNGKRLHVAVWERAHGPRPDGHHVHHIDGDRANNALLNLGCPRAFDHLSEHGREKWLTSPAFRKNIEKATAAARAWHSTEAGRAFHVENGHRAARAIAARAVTKRCEECGSAFRDSTAAHIARTCHPNCYARLYRRERRIHGRL